MSIEKVTRTIVGLVLKPSDFKNWSKRWDIQQLEKLLDADTAWVQIFEEDSSIYLGIDLDLENHPLTIEELLTTDWNTYLQIIKNEYQNLVNTGELKDSPCPIIKLFNFSRG